MAGAHEETQPRTMPEAIGRQAEQDHLRDLDRARRVLSECARALAHATDERQFLAEICRIAVESGGYSMAWVGFARDDAARSIERVASAADHGGYFAKARISWGDDEFGSGPAGRAVRSGQTQVVQNLHLATDFLLWRANALGLGHQAVTSLPLKLEDEVIGVFGIFAAEPNAFSALAIELLEDVARNVAFGIQTLRLREAQRRAEAGLRASEQRFHATFDQAPAGIAHVDLDGRITLANRRLETILGYAPGELIGRTVSRLSHPEDAEITVPERARLGAGEIASLTTQKRYLRKDGSVVWVGLTISLMRDADGRALYDIAVFEDISARVRDQALQRLEHMVTRELAESDSASASLHAAIRTICTAENWDCGRCFTPDEKAGVLRFAGAWGVDDPVIAQFLSESRDVTYAPGIGLMGLVWQSGEPVWASDIGNDPRVARGIVARKAAMRGSFVFPLRVEGRVIGVLNFNSREVRETEPRLLEVIESIGRQIGQFLLRKRAEEAQRRFRIAMDTSADIIALIDAETLLHIDVNQTACEVHGYTREQMLAIGPVEVTGKSREFFVGNFAELISHGLPDRIVSSRKRADGSVFPTEVLRRAVMLDGRWMIVAIVRDISERVDAEQNMRRSEARFRSLVELSSDGFWESDAEHRFTTLTLGSGFSTLYDIEGPMGKRRWDFPAVYPDAAGWAAHEATLNAHQRFQDFEYARTGPDGRLAYRSVSGEPMFDDKGVFTGYQGVTRDITERKRGEALQRLEHAITRDLAAADSESAAMRAAMRAICEAENWDCGRYFRHDAKTGRLHFADAWGVDDGQIKEFLRDSQSIAFDTSVGVMGLAWRESRPVWSADITADQRVIQGAVAVNHGMHGSLLFPVRAEGGNAGVLVFNSRRVREPEPPLIAAIDAIGSQIGQFLRRKRAEEAQRRFRAALDASADMITLVDPQSMRYIDVNATACEMQGYTREQMLEMGPQDVSELTREELQQAFEKTISSGQPTRHQTRHKRRDGTTFPVEVLRRAVQSDGRWIIVALTRDISEQVEAEQMLRQSEARFRRLTELSSDSYWETDTEHRFVKVVNGSRFEAALSVNAQLGKARWDMPSLSPDAAGWAGLKAMMDAHQPFHEFEFSRAGPSGQLRHRSISGEPIFGEDGRFTGYQGVARDISARKRDEAKMVQLNADLEARVARRTADLERANQELETFSYSVAHDLRAPLRAMTGFSSIVLEENQDKLDAASVRYLKRVKAGGEYMGELVDDLLDLARISRQEMRRQDINLGEVARKVAASLAESNPGRQVEIEIKAHMRAVCDPGLIEIVMSNLIGNAWKFTAKAASARIEVGVKRRDGQSVYFVRDNGAGFEMAYTKNLFAPFQRLHRREDFEGTGIGLSLVKRIIDKHGGKVWAEGAPGKGASFYFTLD
jgi:PAS domain S-box-containing protein